jgi:tagatose-6-phosphate ketose/aldose isomerase
MMLAASLVFHLIENPVPDVVRIARGAREVLDRHNATLQKLAAESYSRVVYLGSNGFKGLAREAALKLLELTDGKVVGAFDSPLGFRHGPKTIVTGDTLVFVFMSNDPYTRGYDLDLLRELRSDAVAGRVIAVTAQPHDAVTQGEHLHVPHLADAPDGELYFPYIVCGQLYAFHRSLSVGNTPDQPSNSGTVSRVVSGVTIHTL